MDLDAICKNLPLSELLRDYSGNSGAWYWIGMAYWERRDWPNAAKWLEKTMNDSGNHGWQGKATLHLGLIYWKYSNRQQDALRLFESIPSFARARLNAGLMYFHGEGTSRDAVKGLRLVEEAIVVINDAQGNDSLFSPLECLKMSEVFYEGGKREKAKEYLRKSIQRCDLAYESDREIKSMAENNLRLMGG